MNNDIAQSLSPSTLTEIIRVQTEIVKIGLDLGSVMNLVASEVQHLTGAVGAIVELAEGEDMVYRSATGLAAPQLGLRLNLNTSLSGLCVKSGEVLICADSETDPRVDRLACRKVGLRSMVVSPLFHGQSAVGVLKIIAENANHFTDEHVRILELMSGLIASSMFHCAQFELQELYFKATHDVMTGLANRALFYDRLRQRLQLALRQSSLVGILNLDMDGLKTINDNHGHRAGDAAIRELAARTARAARQSDTVARLGGDEFAVLLAEVDGRNSIEIVASRIAEEIRKPFEFEGTPLNFDASIGMAVFPEDATELDTLIEIADQSMYQSKKARKAGRS